MNTEYSDFEYDQIDREMQQQLDSDNALEYINVINKYFASHSNYAMALKDGLNSAMYAQAPNCFQAVYDKIVASNFTLQVAQRLYQENDVDTLEALLHNSTAQEQVINTLKGNMLCANINALNLQKKCVLVLYKYNAVSWEENDFVYGHCIGETHSMKVPNQIFIDLCKAAYALRQTQPTRLCQTYAFDAVQKIAIEN